MRPLRSVWDRLGRTDPLWAVLSDPAKRGNRWSIDEFLATGERVVDDVFRVLDEREIRVGSADALDFGCGAGRLTQALAGRFAHVVGVDIAPSMLEVARQLNRKGDAIEFVLNDRIDLQVVGDRRFDLVLSSITLQHMETAYSRSYIAEFVRILAPGGIAVFDIPFPMDRQRFKEAAPRPILHAYQWLRSLRRPRMEMYGLDRDEVERIVRRAGGVVSFSQPSRAGVRAGQRYFVARTAA